MTLSLTHHVSGSVAELNLKHFLVLWHRIWWWTNYFDVIVDASCEWVCSRTKFETNSVKTDHSVSNYAKIAIKEKVFTIQCCEYYEKISAEFPINASNVGISNWDLKDSKNKKQQGIKPSHVRKWTIFKTTKTTLAIFVITTWKVTFPNLHWL